MWITDFGLFVWIYLISLLWQAISFPFLRVVFGKLVDDGWAVGRVLSSMVISVVIFFFANLGLPINSNSGLVSIAVIFSIISLSVYKKNK